MGGGSVKCRSAAWSEVCWSTHTCQGTFGLGVHKAQTCKKHYTKPQWKDIGILPADSIHMIRHKFVSNRIYEAACLVQVAINVLRYSPCCYIVLTVTLTFITDFLCPKGCTVLKKYRDGKSWEDTWNRVAEFPRTFLFPQVLWSWVYIVTMSLNQ